MLSRSNTLILTLAVVASVIGGYVQHRNQPSTSYGGLTDTTLIGQPAPAFLLPDLDGKPHRLADNHGRRVLLNFWASWCVPCLAEMPALNRAQARTGNNGPVIIGIAMDDPAHVRRFLATHPLDYPILLGDLADPSTSALFGDTQTVLPYSVLIDANGTIMATHVGALTSSELESWLIGAPRP
ncbi:TlpA disulfide reductase family protein [Rhodanobacter sp. L36]|uniref:TlpA family protein disulfide reductase n=1 Tax=Rhodanobacter sp. L36 TaxID=1747221 RepID=UPI00131BA0FB|nr:TlpA disulfide reductase family protein [Rhodanobacter sp. L36]